MNRLLKGRLTCSFLIEAGKCIPDNFLRVCAIELLSKHGEEHGEVNGPGSFIHHGLQVFISWVLSCVREKMCSRLFKNVCLKYILPLQQLIKQMLSK